METCTSQILIYGVTYRTTHLMNRCRTSLELFFAIWFVMGNVWVFDSRFSSFPGAPKLHVLCISLLAWNAISYSFPFLLFVLLCCCVPLMSSLLGYNMNMGSIDKAASDDQISQLPSWRYKEVNTKVELGNDCDSGCLANEDPVSHSYTYKTKSGLALQIVCVLLGVSSHMRILVSPL